MESKPAWLILTGIKTNQHGDKMHWWGIRAHGWKISPQRLSLSCDGQVLKGTSSVNQSCCVPFSPFFPGWDIITRSLCSPRCETSTMITSQSLCEAWAHSHAPCLCLGHFPLPAPAKTPVKICKGNFCFFLCLYHSLFFYSHCWHSLSSSTHFHLAANSFPQSQMELQPNTAPIKCGFPPVPYIR